MIKQTIKNILEKFGYIIVKKYKSGHEDALIYNSLKNVNSKNSDLVHFQKNIKSDSVFIDCIYPYLNKQFINNEITFLDVGCGSGVLVNKLIEDSVSKSAKGCDFSEVKIMQCNKFYNSNSFFIHDIMEPLKEEFDLITCTEVLEHLEYPEQALSNLLGALKENANLVITVPNGRKDTYGGHIHFWSPESFKLFITKGLLDYDVDFFTLEFKLLCEKNYVQIKKMK